MKKKKLTIGEIIQYLNKYEVKIIDMITDDGNLEDVFVSLINR